MLPVNPLQRSIIETLAYFDIVDFPLMREELFRYLWRPPEVTYEEFTNYLDEIVDVTPPNPPDVWSGQALLTVEEREAGVSPSPQEERAGVKLSSPPLTTKRRPGVQTKWSYLFFSGRESTITKRRHATVPTELKLRKAQYVARFISWLPFLKAIFISSSVATETAHEGSDIDFFIITHPHRIWLVRFLANSILRLCGLRIYGTKRKDRSCLCFFVDTDHLDLSPWRIAEDDIHFIYWLHQMVPLYDPEGIYARFIAANAWTRPYVPHMPHEERPLSKKQGKVGQIVKKSGERVLKGFWGDLVERSVKRLQWLKLRSSLKEKSFKDDKEVVITSGVLKFHDHDTRGSYREQWMERIKRAEDS